MAHVFDKLVAADSILVTVFKFGRRVSVIGWSLAVCITAFLYTHNGRYNMKYSVSCVPGIAYLCRSPKHCAEIKVTI